MRKKERNEIYKAMLKYAIADPRVDYGFCSLLNKIYFEDAISLALYYRYNSINDFKELISYRPKNYVFGEYWFPATYEGWEKRIEILQKCIKKTN